MSQYSIQVTFSQSLGASFNDICGNPYTLDSGNTYLSQGNLSSIGNNAFDASMNANFKFLTILKIPDSVSLIGSYAFNSCTRLKTVTSTSNIYSSPFNLVLQDYAFYGDVSLNSFTNNNISSIGNYTFAGCINLPKIEITRLVVTTIGNNAFDGCTKFVSFFNDNGNYLYVFPITLTSVGDYAFRNCTSITYFYKDLNMNIHNYNITYLGRNAFEGCTSLKEFVIPCQITVIPPNLFYGCTDLSFVRMSMVTDISDSAFYGCTKLNYISFNKNITTIRNNAFYGCTKLASLTIPFFVSFIGSNAFYGCTGMYYAFFHKNSSLTQSTNPESIGYLDPTAFNNCSMLTDGTVFIYQTDTFLNTYFGSKTYNYSQDILVFRDTSGNFTDTSIPTPQTYTKVKNMSANLFLYISNIQPTVIYGNAYVNNKTILDIIIPPTITRIGDEAFGGTNIKNIFIPNTVQTIGNSTFQDMMNLNSCVLDNSFTSLTFGSFCFYNCRSLTFFYMNNGITGNNPIFYDDVWLMNFIFDPSLNLTEIAHSSFRNCINLITINIPDSVTRMNNYSFRNCRNLLDINFTNQSSLTYIGYGSFDICISLMTINFPPLVNTIGDYAFKDCRFVNITLPTLLTTIGNYAFTNCPIVNFTIPSSVISIGTGILSNSNEFGYFFDNTILQNVYIDQNASLQTIGVRAFYKCVNLNSFTFSNHLISIGDYAFSNCSLTSVVFPTTLKNIGVGVFLKIGDDNIFITSDLESIVFSLPSSLTYIGSYAFYQSRITSLNLPDSLVTIDFAGFANNYYLTTVNVTTYSQLTNIGTIAFSQCPKLVNFYFPVTIQNISNGAFSQDNSLNAITFDYDLSNNFNLNNDAFTNTYLQSVTISANNQFLKAFFKSPSTVANIGSNYTIYYLRAPCFLEGTKILCLNENWDVVYIPIEKIRPGMKVKTLKNGYVSVSMIGTSEMYNTGDDERIIERLYRCPKNHYPELFEDLVMTGCHSILVDQMSYEQVIKTLKEFKNVVYMTDDKCRLIACFDERAIPYDQEGTFPIWHIALEHEDDFANYGVYANGLLVESCSKDYLIHHSGMKILEFSS